MKDSPTPLISLEEEYLPENPAFYPMRGCNRCVFLLLVLLPGIESFLTETTKIHDLQPRIIGVLCIASLSKFDATLLHF